MSCNPRMPGVLDLWRVGLALLVLAAPAAAGAVVYVDRFEPPLVWRARSDGGHPPSCELVTAPSGRRGWALHLHYRDLPPHWGNVERPVSLPSSHGLISLWVYRHRAAPEAKLHLLLIEPDGDFWAAPLEWEGKPLGQWRRGWHRVTVNLDDMRYEARGDGKRQRGAAHLLAVTCNYGDLEVSLADLQLEPYGEPAPGWEERDGGLVRRARIDLAASPDETAQMLGSGWWEREQDGCWTGREARSGALLVPAWAGYDYLVSCYIIGGPPGWGGDTNALTCRLNGVPVTVRRGPRPQEYWALLPAPARGGKLRLEVGADPWTPGGPDTRTLGVKLRAIELWAFRRSPLAASLLRQRPSPSLALFVPPGRSPRRPARVLTSWGHRVVALGPEEVLNPALLSPERCWGLAVLDDRFPALGKEALIHFLSRGGHLVALQGYAFDRLLVRQEEGWRVANVRPGINTHYGEPRDALAVGREQVGAFDPSFPLEQAAGLRAAPDQVLTGPVAAAGACRGWAACALVASNNPVFPEVWARRIPLLEAHDRVGRPVGAALSLVHHWAGPYAGSSWLLCGVENRSLLLEGKLAPALRRGLEALRRRVYVRDFATGYACYRPGERAEASFIVHNGSGRAAGLAWRVTAYRASNGKLATAASGRVQVAGGAAARVKVPLDLPAGESCYRLNCLVSEGKQALDLAATGCCFWQADRVARGPALGLEGNYFRFGGRPMFLCGTNQTGIMFGSPLENPLVWRRDLQSMADHGLNVLRILHFSPFAMPPQPRGDPEAALRKLDAIVQLAQEAGVVIFLSLHDWLPVELDQAGLAAQRAWARQVADRYREAPGVMYDVQNEPSVAPERQAAAVPLWREFLRARYESDRRLAAVWGRPVAIESAELSRGEDGWSSVQSADYDRFRAWLLNRWARENIAGVKEAQPGALCTVGYLPWPEPADQVLGGEAVDFANMHYYGPLADFPSRFKWSDQRALGRSLSLGEFGVKAHPAWPASNEVGLSEREGVRRLLGIVHYALGLGGSLVANWDWKDMSECIFPWGLNHPGDLVPKDFLRAYRNFSLLLRPWQPAYQDPELYLLLADEHRLGGSRGWAVRCQQGAINLLLGCQANFGVINEGNLDRLPAGARAIIYPAPFCPDDATVERLRSFVEAGGLLYLSGDLTFAPDRRRTRSERLEALCGVKLGQPLAEPPQEGPEVRVQGEGLPSYEAHPCLQVEPAGAQVLAECQRTGGVVFLHRLGRGAVMFTTDLPELHPGRGAQAIYARFLQQAGIAPACPGMPADLHAFSLPGADGGMLCLAYNPGAEPAAVSFSHGGDQLALAVPPRGWALALFGPQGQVQAVEGTGQVAVGGQPLLRATCPLMMLAGDEGGLRPQGPLVLMPLEQGSITLPWRVEAEAGSFERLRWRPHERVAPRAQAAGCTLEVDQARRLGILIAGSRGQIEKAAQRLERLLALPSGWQQ